MTPRNRKLQAVPEAHELADHTHVGMEEALHASRVHTTDVARLEDIDLEALVGELRARQLRAIFMLTAKFAGAIAGAILALREVGLL